MTRHTPEPWCGSDAILDHADWERAEAALAPFRKD